MPFPCRILAPAIAALALAPVSSSAADLFSRDTVSGVALLGAAVGAGERSWVDRGLGKLRQGDGASTIGDLTVAWRPSLTDRVGALVSVQAQGVGEPAVGVNEAYLVLRPDPAAAVRLSGRLGVFFPPISLEHDGSEWSLSHTLSASAINSWVAEEVKTTGVEGKVRLGVAGRPVALTLAAFQGNDTSGALLTFRGWAIHDVRSNINGTLPLPPISSLFGGNQAVNTRPTEEVDGRWGAYGRLDLEPMDRLQVSLFAFDNNGDPTALVRGQYAWRTRFAQLAARWRGDGGGEVLAQAMTGETAMGRLYWGERPARVNFDAAYVLLSQPVGRSELTGRLDYFAVSDLTFKDRDNNAETGWAATAAWTRPVSTQAQWVVEGLVSTSVRPARRTLGDAPRQTAAQLRTAIRLSF
jgi:hypothetical protein